MCVWRRLCLKRSLATDIVAPLSNGQSVGEYTGDLAPDAIHAFIEEVRGQGAAPHAIVKGKGQPLPPAYVWCAWAWRVIGWPWPSSEAFHTSRRHDHAHMVQLTLDSFDAEMARHRFAVVNFGADWCRWTRALLPQYAAASQVRAARVPLHTLCPWVWTYLPLPTPGGGRHASRCAGRER
jgi:hypothetical protein